MRKEFNPHGIFYSLHQHGRHFIVLNTKDLKQQLEAARGRTTRKFRAITLINICAWCSGRFDLS